MNEKSGRWKVIDPENGRPGKWSTRKVVVPESGRQCRVGRCASHRTESGRHGKSSTGN